MSTTEPDKIYKNVPVEDVGEFVQQHVDAGKERLLVVVDDGGETCTVSVWKKKA